MLGRAAQATRGGTHGVCAQGTSLGVRGGAGFRSMDEARGATARIPREEGCGGAVHGAEGEMRREAGERTGVQQAGAEGCGESRQWKWALGLLSRTGGETGERDRLIRVVAGEMAKVLQREGGDWAKVEWGLSGGVTSSPCGCGAGDQRFRRTAQHWRIQMA